LVKDATTKENGKYSATKQECNLEKSPGTGDPRYFTNEEHFGKLDICIVENTAKSVVFFAMQMSSFPKCSSLGSIIGKQNRLLGSTYY